MTCFRMKDGETLRKYCLRKGIKYDSVMKYLDKGYPPEEAIEAYFRCKCNKSHPRIFVDGVPLKQYCREHNLKLFMVDCLGGFH